MAAAAGAAVVARREASRRPVRTITVPAVVVLALLASSMQPTNGQRASGFLAAWMGSSRSSSQTTTKRPAPPRPTTLKPQDPQLAIPCACSDVDPRDSFLRAKVDFSCYDQARFGSCSQPFMLETPEEIPEGYCQISCGRCSCCPSLDDVLKYKGLEMFRWMLSFSEEGDKTKQPGYMVTLLAPTDGAVWSALNRLGYSSKEVVEKDSNARGILADVGRYHVLPPVEPLKATWTTPFMRGGVTMYTFLSGGRTVSGSQDGGGQVTLSSPKSSARVVERDLYACKGYVQVVDAVLIPWAMQGYA